MKKSLKAAAGVLLVIVALSLVLLLLIPRDVQHHGAVSISLPLSPSLSVRVDRSAAEVHRQQEER